MRGRIVAVSTGTNAERSPWKCRSEVRCLMLCKLTKAKRETTLKNANLKKGATSKHEAKNGNQGKVVEVQLEKQSLLNL